MPFTSDSARRAGKRSGASRRRLTIDRVEDELGALGSLEDAERWLRTLGIWGAAGLLTGAVLGGCVRAVDVWVRAHEAKLTRKVVDEIQARVNALEAQLRTPSRPGLVR